MHGHFRYTTACNLEIEFWFWWCPEDKQAGQPWKLRMHRPLKSQSSSTIRHVHSQAIYLYLCCLPSPDTSQTTSRTSRGHPILISLSRMLFKRTEIFVVTSMRCVELRVLRVVTWIDTRASQTISIFDHATTAFKLREQVSIIAAHDLSCCPASLPHSQCDRVAWIAKV